eukprot:scaffold116485_cov39-Tisochrysis_lutea.AAC.2
MQSCASREPAVRSCAQRAAPEHVAKRARRAGEPPAPSHPHPLARSRYVRGYVYSLHGLRTAREGKVNGSLCCSPPLLHTLNVCALFSGYLEPERIWGQPMVWLLAAWRRLVLR